MYISTFNSNYKFCDTSLSFSVCLFLCLSLSLYLCLCLSVSLSVSLSSHFYPLVNGCWIFNYITIAIHTKLCTTQLPKHHAAMLIPQNAIMMFQNLMIVNHVYPSPAQVFLFSAPVSIVLMNSVLLASLSMVHQISVLVTLKLEIICSLF